MAHNIAIDKLTGERAFFTAETKAWHDELGTNVKGIQSYDSVLQAAKMDWEVRKVSLFTNWSKSGLLQVPDMCALVRMDTHETLGIHTTGYQEHQNARILKVMSGMNDFESAGVLGKGERVWILARVPQADFTIGSNDQHKSYLLATGSHDGSMSTQYMLTSTRVECENTLTMALHNDGKNSAKVRHTKNSLQRLDELQNLLNDAVQNAAGLQEKLTLFAEHKLSKESFLAIVDKLFPLDGENASQATKTRRENTVTQVAQLYADNDGNAFPEQRGTAYNLLNAVTNYVDHERSTRLAADDTRTNSQSRAESAIWGSGAQFKNNAMRVIEQVIMSDGSVVDHERPTFDPDGGNLLGQIIRNQFGSN